MTVPPPDRLYGYLPTFFREADQAQGQPARALLAIVEAELNALERNMQALYDNWFVETCEPWVVPYIADLLGIAGLTGGGSPGDDGARQRERVADAVRFYRRKGTPGTLEEVAALTTGWAVRLVVYARLLARAQNVKHVLLHDGRTVDVRDTMALNDLGGPFEAIAHTVDLRPIAAAAVTGTGRFNLPDVGLFVWRLRPYGTHYQAVVPPGTTVAEYTVNPFGVDTPLFNRPRPRPGARGGESSGDDRARLPIALTRALFAADLAWAQRQPDASSTVNSAFYGPARGLNVLRDGHLIRPAEVASADLDWSRPGFRLDWTSRPLADKALAIDVERGRLALRDAPSRSLDVHYTYGLSGDLGGGPYDRRGSLPTSVPAGTKEYVVGRDRPYQTIQDALAAWAADVLHGTTRGVVKIADNGVYQLPTTADGAVVALPAGGALAIQAENGRAPFVVGSFTVRTLVPPAAGATPAAGIAPPALTLDGLLVDGRIALQQAVRLTLRHTTLVPRARRHSIAWAHDRHDTAAVVGLHVTLDRCIVGMLRLPPEADGLVIANSIVDAVPPAGGARHPAISAGPHGHAPPYGPATTLAGVTIFGPVTVVQFGDSRDVIFGGTVLAQRTQLGSLSFSYVPPDSVTPRRFRCQPDLALGETTDPAVRAEIERNVQPSFTATTYGQPGYAQLSRACSDAITRGGDDGSEMGVFGSLGAARRRESLTSVLDEYLSVGLQPGVFYVT